MSDDPRAWNAANVQSVGGGCVIVGDQLRFYFSGRAATNESRTSTGLATLRRDGFASMDANSVAPGILTTRLVKFTGKHLFVNTDVEKGALQAEVLDEQGRPVVPFTTDNSIPFTGASTAHRCQWKGADDLSALGGKLSACVFLGSIHSGANSNNSGGAPSGIQVGFNPDNANVFNNDVFGNVSVFVSGSITADVGQGIDAYNYGVGDIAVMLGFGASITASGTVSGAGKAAYGIGAFNYGPGNISVTTSGGDVITSQSSGINASNQASSIAAGADALVTVSTATGPIHSGTMNNNSGSTPSGITAGFLGGTSSVANLNVNGTVIVNNAANITADAGYGINAYNYGNGDITVNQASGTTVSGVVQGITAHSEAVGATGNVAVNLYNGVTVNATSNAQSAYGVNASTNGKGSISVITNPGDVINSGSIGINAVNLAPIVEASYDSSVVVTAAGTIHSRSAATGTGNQPAGISAGYLGPAPGGVVTTTYPLTDVHGDVVVNSSANITADAGDGIRVFDYGIGDILVNVLGGTITALDVGSSTPGLGNGIAASNYGSGNVRVATAAGTSINSGASGIVAVNKAPSSGPFVVPSTSETSVLAFGTIVSGSVLTGSGDPAAGILAGYNPANADAPDDNVHGNVLVDDYATITAAAGTDGIRGVNYGTGDIAIIVESGAGVTGGRYGVAALGYDGGDVSITNNGLVRATDAGASVFSVIATTTSTGTAVIDNLGHVIGNVSAYNATFTNEVGADWSLNGTSLFTGASTLVNMGLIDSNGVSAISGLLGITNTGTIEVQSGNLTVGGPMTGAGNVAIYGATMELAGASDAHVQFTSTLVGKLVLDDAAHFTGTVTGFGAGDTIDLVGITPASVSVSGHLISYGTGSFELAGNYDPTGFTIASDGGTGTNITWSHQAPVIDTSNLTTVSNPDGTTTVLGVQVTDSDPAVSSETFNLSGTTGAAASGSSITPASDSGSLTHVNSTFTTGVTYNPGATPPLTDKVTLTVTDGFGATDTVNFVFNQAGTGPNVTLQGTSGKDVIFATGSADVLTGGAGQDQFLFKVAASGLVQHTITDFEVGIDKLDVRQFSGITAASIPTAVQTGSDTLITLDSHDALLLKNVLASSVHASDYIVHA